MKKVLLTQQIHFPEEVRSMDELKIEKQSFEKEEMQMMEKYIADNTMKFDITEHHNKYSAALLRIIKDKVNHKPHRKNMKVVKSSSDTTAENLMKLLEESLKKPKAKKA